MKSDLKIRKFTQDVLQLLCFKHQIITEEPTPDLRWTPEITLQLMNNVCKATWVQTFQNDYLWSGFFQKHYQRMTSSPEMFTKYVSYACYSFLEAVTDEYIRVFDTLTLVAYFGIRCWEQGSKQFLNTCVELFCALYEKELRSGFESKGGFENYNKFIEDEIFERDFKVMFDKDIPSFEHFEQLQTSAFHKRAFKKYNETIESRDQTEVETDENVVRFSKPVEGKIGELCRRTFDQLLIGFARTNIQLKEIHRQTFGEASVELSSELEPTSSGKIIEETPKITRKKAEILEIARQMVKSHKLDTHDAEEPIKASHLSPKAEKLKKILDDIAADYSRLYGIIQSLCEQHKIQFPVLMEKETNV